MVRVGSEGMRFGGVSHRAPDEIDDVSVGERIEDVFAGAPPRHDALGAEQPKLLRHRRQSDARGIGELRHAPLSTAEPNQKLQPCRLAHRPEDGGGALDLLVRSVAIGIPARVLVRATMPCFGVVGTPRPPPGRPRDVLGGAFR